MDVISVLVFGALLVFVIRLSGRVKSIEATLKPRGQATPATPSNTSAPQTKNSVPGTATNPAQVIMQEPQSGLTKPVSSDVLIDWLKDDWLLKLGAILLLIGFGWFARYAFLNNWIGPAGRITIGLLVGVVTLIFGWLRLHTHRRQGEVFLVLGSTIILITTYAAREFYDFFNPGIALLVMFLSTAFVGAASVRYRSQGLALSGLILAGVAPLLTASSNPSQIALFAYLFVVTLGIIWIVTLRKWRSLTAAALIMVAFYSVPHFLNTAADGDVILLFIYAFAGLFFIVHTLGAIQLKGEEATPDLVTAAGNGLFLLSWIWTQAPDEWQSLIIAAWMVVFGVGGFTVFRTTGSKRSFYTYIGIGVTYLAAATAIELNGPALTIAYTIETALIPFITYLSTKDRRMTTLATFLLVGPVVLSFNSIVASVWLQSVFHDHFFVLIILTAALFGLGLFFKRLDNEEDNTADVKVDTVMFVVGSLYVFAIIWLSSHAALSNKDTATTFSLITYTVIGIACHFYGKFWEKRHLYAYGGFVLAAVIVRLLIIDVWRMQLTGRIVTFFAIGALLVSTAFLARRKDASSDRKIIST